MNIQHIYMSLYLYLYLYLRIYTAIRSAVHQLHARPSVLSPRILQAKGTSLDPYL